MVKPWLDDGDVRLLHGDCIEVMRTLDEASIDAVVTDPPYGIHFMGKTWDTFGGPLGRDHRTGRERSGSMHAGEYDLSPSAMRGFQSWTQEWATEAFRVLKPGGFLLSFAATRTYHRMACGVEDAGFEVRDMLAWLFGSGFPKSLDVAKAIDKAAGATREVVGQGENYGAARAADGKVAYGDYAGTWGITAPATPEAAQWAGWGTALKPGHEPVVMARKPFRGTVAANVLAHGTGALNIDACRIDGEQRPKITHDGRDTRRFAEGGLQGGYRREGGTDEGRWPANVLLDPDAADLLDEQSGQLVSGANPTRRHGDKFRTAYGEFAGQAECEAARGVDVGGASRFFYVAKPTRAERDEGLQATTSGAAAVGRTEGSAGLSNPRAGAGRTADKVANFHPTVKPIALMRHLIRLVTTGGGLVLDPFAGSGTTLIAARREGMRAIGIELSDEYLPIIAGRLSQQSLFALDDAG